MRFPSLFRLPRYQQFEIKPRYYDPIKEEIKERTNRIKKGLDKSDDADYQPAQIHFKRKATSAPATSMIQLTIAAILGIMIVSWLQFGNVAFYYLLWIIVPGYLFYRIRTLKKKK